MPQHNNMPPYKKGKMPEWSIGPHSKCGERASVPRVRISVFPQNPHKSLNDNNLQENYCQTGTETGQDGLIDSFSLYRALSELCKEKKMSLFPHTRYIDYIPARLSTGKVWYVYYYVKDPATGKFRRFRIKLERYGASREKREAAQIIIKRLNEQLALGWNPMIQESAPKAYCLFSEALDSYLSVKDREVEASSQRCYRSYIKIILQWLRGKGYSDQMYACSFTHALALDFMGDVEADVKLSYRTYNNYLLFYRSMFNWMKDKGYISDNPFDGIKRKPKRLIRKTRRTLTDEELSRLFGYLDSANRPYLAICLLCYCCLMRPKEIALLRCRDIDLGTQTVHVRGEIAKNDNDSYRTIPDEMMPYMRELDLSHPEWFLFGEHKQYDFSPGTQQVDGKKIAKYWSDHLRRTCKFPMDLKFYSLKDTGITNMLGSGVPVSFVKQQADHHSLAMTTIYLGHTSKANDTLKKTKIIK